MFSVVGNPELTTFLQNANADLDHYAFEHEIIPSEHPTDRLARDMRGLLDLLGAACPYIGDIVSIEAPTHLIEPRDAQSDRDGCINLTVSGGIIIGELRGFNAFGYIPRGSRNHLFGLATNVHTAEIEIDGEMGPKIVMTPLEGSIIRFIMSHAELN